DSRHHSPPEPAAGQRGARDRALARRDHAVILGAAGVPRSALRGPRNDPGGPPGDAAGPGAVPRPAGARPVATDGRVQVPGPARTLHPPRHARSVRLAAALAVGRALLNVVGVGPRFDRPVPA